RVASAMSQYLPMGVPRHFTDSNLYFAHIQSQLTPQDRWEAQPSRHADGRFVLMLDGWLANREELIQALLLRSPRTRLPDSAILAAALLQWGDAALLRLHGSFALAWWDTAEHRLLLACDRTGGRALFYHQSGQRLYFANLLDTLLAHPDVPRELHAERVARTMFAHTLDLAQTCFRDVAQLEPAHKLVWTHEGVQVERYWRIDSHRRIRFAKDGDYVEAARALLDTVVAQSLRAEGVPLCHLSGGLDSTAVASTAARLHAPDMVHTMTYRPDAASSLPRPKKDRFYDEWPHAQTVVASYPNMVAHEVAPKFDWETLEQEYRAKVAVLGHPRLFFMTSVMGAESARLAKQLGAKAVLTGVSGNATLSASALSYHPYTRLGELPAALADVWRRLRLDASPSNWRKAAGCLLPPALRHWRDHLRTKHAPWQNTLPVREAVFEQIDMPSVWQDHIQGDTEIPWQLRSRVRLMERTWLARSAGTAARFHSGYETRDPLGDVRLAEFCLALPLNQFTRPGMDRALARRVLADRLPPLVLNERRVGRSFPEWFDWLTRSRPMFAAELDRIEASALGRELIDVPRLRAILDDWPTDATEADQHYQRLMWVLGGGVAMGAFLRWAEGSNQ
ncbi:MAG: hypothetical protein KGZ83_13285, partial [Sulfuricella sp.]|nr:hypothetical protein [Sulfuricella sp.]